jgi:hypothetical protein
MGKEAFESKVVAPSDVLMIQDYSTRLGKASNLQGFAKFAEQQAIGLFSAALGVIVAEQPILIATIAASREPSGAVLWSTRAFNNTQLPGTPDTFSNVIEALKAMDDYMLHMARSLGQQAESEKKSLFKKILSGW